MSPDATASPAADPTSRGSADRSLEMRSKPLARRTDTPQPPRHMPADLSISLRAKRAVDRVIASPGGPRRQPLRGYEETFTDIVDFILRCTHRIWDERSIGYLYEHYRSNTRVIDDPGMVYGRDRIIETTARFLAAYPDVRHHADEIIWCGDEDQGFWTSHRLYLIGHNTGASQWGPPTGRRIVLMVIANCYSVENQIVDEFVIHNTGSLIRQLGLDMDVVVGQLAAEEPLPTGAVGEAERLLGQAAPPIPTPPTDASDIDAVVRSAQDRLWNWRLLDTVDDAYAAGFRLHGPTDLELYGRGQYKAYVLSLLAMLPDLAYQVDDLYWMGNEQEDYLVALRWSILGTHRGHGFLGAPTGRPVRLWGLTHLVVRSGQIVEEWTVSNEFCVRVALAARDAPTRPA